MAIQDRILFLPEGAEVVSEHLAMARQEGRMIFFDASGPIFAFEERDEAAVRLAGAMLTDPVLGLATPSELALPFTRK